MQVYEADFSKEYGSIREIIRTHYSSRASYASSTFLLENFYNKIENEAAQVEEILYLLRFHMAMKYEVYWRKRRGPRALP